MIGIDDETVELKTRCVPLIFDCPRKMRSRKCPFRTVREEPDIVRRVNWIKAKQVDELRAMLKKHVTCMKG